ncbi:S-methyl-5'-thioinosine phosphorylase [Simiduia sp. 21SJ11W-1]|uniref:S-methyl-5'-thioinosine phosphorylase n=1 Tax=Simiduia sp. 21SJ11W-1 TaxID=2909669 RepID=UPI0020A12263|nr:S-methyl-5'-thioinosine phosphorylase [Simiduia sp. 21SJ11W-1]UTA49392.1 S-methyl-5'-thioinosine phosphorylase [Simiduia sp. 21SJ11W-1]
MLAVIGGSGWESMPGLTVQGHSVLATPYGDLAEPIVRAELNGVPLLFLSRHGANHQLAPHQINYRANIWALKNAGATAVLAINAVGGITEDFAPGTLALPDQLIDYTWGREHTFWAGDMLHVDFAEPFAGLLRERVLAAAASAKVRLHAGGTYGVTQGPRLETAAEIARLARDGCNLVGMTAMPEAALAREQALAYASVCIVVNWAAGVSQDKITVEFIYQVLEDSRAPLEALLALLPAQFAV